MDERELTSRRSSANVRERFSRPSEDLHRGFPASLALVSLILLTAGGQLVPGAPGGGNFPAFVPGEILIKFKPYVQTLDRSNAKTQVHALRAHAFRSGAEHWKLGTGIGVEEAVERMKRNPNVAYVEPNYLLSVKIVPNDPNLGDLWSLINTGQTGGTPGADIDADRAWAITTGSRSVVAGVIDTGCDYNHPDLAANIWTNPGEIAGNGIDDDHNGFIDDVHGYDFANNDGDPFDDNGHGTHVSGILGAVGNNGVGIVGVNWQVSLMCLKFIAASGTGTTSNAIRALDYAVQMGVDLTNNSWGSSTFSQAMIDAITQASAAEQVFVAAAGNDGLDTDVTPHYPSSYDLPNVISVAATDPNDARASFSNFGATTVHLGAPGVGILSTLPGNSYGAVSGTSMAAPFVSGVVALLRAISPGMPAVQVKNQVLSSVDAKGTLQGITVSGGRLNAFSSIATPDAIAPGVIGDLTAATPGTNTMGLEWTATGDDGASGTAAYYEVRYSTSPIDETSFGSSARAGNEPRPAPSGTQGDHGGPGSFDRHELPVRRESLRRMGDAGTPLEYRHGADASPSDRVGLPSDTLSVTPDGRAGNGDRDAHEHRRRNS